MALKFWNIGESNLFIWSATFIILSTTYGQKSNIRDRRTKERDFISYIFMNPHLSIETPQQITDSKVEKEGVE